MRILPDDHYKRWPSFASRITYAYNAAPHDSIGGIIPFQVQHGAPTRDPFSLLLAGDVPVDEDNELTLHALFAEAVSVSTKTFIQLAKTHDEFVRQETVRRLNAKGDTRTFQIGDKVKVRVPPTQEQMLATGRRAKHITAWREPCTITKRISQTSYAAVDDVTNRRYEHVIANLLPYKAKRAKTAADAQSSKRTAMCLPLTNL
jgi:hypothetical protein